MRTRIREAEADPGIGERLQRTGNGIKTSMSRVMGMRRTRVPSGTTCSLK